MIYLSLLVSNINCKIESLLESSYILRVPPKWNIIAVKPLQSSGTSAQVKKPQCPLNLQQ